MAAVGRISTNKATMAHYNLLALRGRQPLCGVGVTSVMETISRPPI